MGEEVKLKVQKVDDWRWRIPREGKMRTDGLVFADETMLKDIRKFSKSVLIVQSGRITNYILVILAVILMYILIKMLV